MKKLRLDLDAAALAATGIPRSRCGKPTRAATRSPSCLGDGARACRPP